ncbi:MAG: carboxypeptidase-like regulatory domain-containing protein [Myxococcaceae bacterium]|nr:carboxypeptidase-like regulatory domain-containing protein [Myxococcaceae bacterium]
MALVAAGLGFWWATSSPEQTPSAGSSFSVAAVAAAVDAGPDTGPRFTLEGVVRDAAGKPVVNAEVRVAPTGQSDLLMATCPFCGQKLLACEARQTGAFVTELLHGHQLELTPVGTTRTGADGKFRFEQLRGVSFTVWASAEGHGEGLRERAAPGELAELTLPSLRSVVGSVFDGAGKPLSATVAAVSRRLARTFIVQTDAAGAFTLKGLGEGPFYVTARAEGYLPSVRLEVEADAAPVRLMLAEARQLEVTLMYQGKPIEGTVRLSADHLNQQLPTTAALARFDALYPDRVVVTAVAGQLSSAPQAVMLEEKVTRLSLALERGGKILATVNDDEDEPVENPRIDLLTAGGEPVSSLTVARGAVAHFGPIGMGQYWLRASAEGFESVQSPVKVDGPETAVVLTLKRATVLSGRVLDEYGRPTPGISVLVTPTGDSVLADSQGRFVAPVPSPGLYELQAHHSDWGGGSLKVTAPKSGVELHLEPRAGVEITVMADGRRVEGASVVLFIQEQGNFRNDRLSGTDGVVTMRGMPAGTYTLIAAHPEYLPSQRQTLELKEGELQHVTVQLSRGAAVTGVVVDTAGTAVAGVAVVASPRGAEPATTDALGRFEIRPLKPNGAYVLRVTDRGFEQTERTRAFPGGPLIKIVVRRHDIFRGRVLSDGVPLTRYRIDDNEVATSDGRFELALPSADGRVFFAIDAPGYEPVMIDRPAVTDLGDFSLVAAPRFSGMVRDENGQPVADATVACDGCEESTMTGVDGKFVLSSPPFLRSFTLTARKGRKSGSMRVQAGTPTVSVVLSGGVKVSGVVYRPNGQPAAGVVVEGEHADRSEIVSLVTAADGSFSADLAPGSYRFATEADGSRIASDAIAYICEVQGDQQRLDFGAAPGTTSVTVRVQPQRGYALWVVRGDLNAVGNPPMELSRSAWAQIIYQPTTAQVTVNGLAPGRYTLVWASYHGETETGPQRVSITVPGQGEVSMLPQSASP